MNLPSGKSTNAALWISMLVAAAVGEISAFIAAISFGLSAFSQTDGEQRSRLWASAGWCLIAMVAFTAVSTWSLLRLLRIVARQAPNASFETGER